MAGSVLANVGRVAAPAVSPQSVAPTAQQNPASTNTHQMVHQLQHSAQATVATLQATGKNIKFDPTGKRAESSSPEEKIKKEEKEKETDIEKQDVSGRRTLGVA